MRYLVPIYVLGKNNVGKDTFKKNLLNGEKYFFVTDNKDTEIYLNIKVADLETILVEAPT